MSAWNATVPSRAHLREKKREALVAQAAQEFRKRGYHATSMDDIAAALGVSKGALYRYVKSKDEVLYECFMHSNRIGEMALEKARKLEGNAAEKLHGFMVEFIRAYLDSNLAGGAMIEIDALLPGQRKDVVKGRDKIDVQLRRLIERGVKDGSVAPESAKLIIFTFMGSINWIPSWFSSEGEFSSETIAEHVSRILVNGIKSRA